MTLILSPSDLLSLSGFEAGLCLSRPTALILAETLEPRLQGQAMGLSKALTLQLCLDPELLVSDFSLLVPSVLIDHSQDARSPNCPIGS